MNVMEIDLILSDKQERRKIEIETCLKFKTEFKKLCDKYFLNAQGSINLTTTIEDTTKPMIGGRSAV